MKRIVYALVDSSDADHIRYIGQTRESNRLRCHLQEAKKTDKHTHKLHWIRQVLSAGRTVVLLELDTAENYSALIAKETELIKRYRGLGHQLTNCTDGGEGVENPPPDVRAKMSAAAKNRTYSAETRARMSAAQRKRGPRGPMSPDQRAKLSAAKTGTFLTKEHRARVSAGLKGRPCSPETRHKMSIAQKGQIRKPLSDEHRRKVSEALKGRVFSESHRANLAASQAARRQTEVSHV